jgi:hypothetical protein
MNEIEMTLEYLTTKGHAEASALRSRIASIALVEKARHAEDGRDCSSVDVCLEDLSRRTVCLTLLAGSGTRWKRSLEAAALRRGAGAVHDVRCDPSRPRGLYPVRNFLSPSGGVIPIAAYAIAATRGLGRRVIVVRGWEREIDEEILIPMGVASGERVFFEQAAPYGSPLGHADAAWQCRDLWKSAEYVITNFGGDANSRVTVASSLLVLAALKASGEGVDLVIPAARFDRPAYPIRLDENGLPRSFGHAKLKERADVQGPGYANVGVRIYAAAALLEKLESLRGRYWVEGSGYSIPGNDPEGHEFALDNVDESLAAEGRARILAIAEPEELCPVKSLDDIPAFEKAVARVVAADSAFAAPAGAVHTARGQGSRGSGSAM